MTICGETERLGVERGCKFWGLYDQGVDYSSVVGQWDHCKAE